LSEPPRRRREDGARDFIRGPRDGDRILVEGDPRLFDVPTAVEPPKRGRRKPKDIYARYELRDDGAYHYIGQVAKR
jgi:hypothetical protein